MTDDTYNENKATFQLEEVKDLLMVMLASRGLGYAVFLGGGVSLPRAVYKKADLDEYQNFFSRTSQREPVEPLYYPLSPADLLRWLLFEYDVEDTDTNE